ncbi:MAG: ATP-binding protein [Deltaproteobacteria bacterium]|nr:ATP-binding protein [Deltaproteobacteria bacterium]
MHFVDRVNELGRLDALSGPGLAVVSGRRRVGKTRLLLEWNRRRGGIYTVADQSSDPIQRRYFSESIAAHAPGFADAVFPDWRSLLRALAREAQRGAIPGPLIIDEVPYLLASSPSLASVLQNFVDHEGRDSGVMLVLAGSSQRMMQGFVIDSSAPLFGRARESIRLRPLQPGYIGDALSLRSASDCVKAFAVWGGIPRYWELAEPFGVDLERALDALALDPQGPLHREPDLLLLEEQPSAAVLRPLLDAIGAGAHRISEIGGRVGQPATSLSRPLARLVELDLVRREVPFGEPELSGKRALYKLSDPFFRFWFRVVAAHRGWLATSTRAMRRELLHQHLPRLVADEWECMCREAVTRLGALASGRAGPWGPASRYWRGAGPEWDVVSRSIDGKAMLLGEVKWSERPVTDAYLERAYAELLSKGVPDLDACKGSKLVYAVFVSACPAPLKRKKRSFVVIDAADVVAAMRDD